MNQSRWLPKRKIIPDNKSTILLTVSIAVILSVVLLTTFTINEPEYALNHADNRTDILAYVSNESNLVLYNPRSRTEEVVLENVKIFLMSPDGDIAFTRQNEDDPALYIFDVATPDAGPINISQQPGSAVYPLGWSPDERYLAFTSYEDTSDKSLYVWDGENITDVMPDEMLDTAQWFYVDWSIDGRLVFTIEYGWSNLDIPPEIYVWDGNQTSNLSQNAEGWDAGAFWNRDGQVLFESRRGDEINVVVWDGVSFQAGLPDIYTVIEGGSLWEPLYPTWTNDGFLAFTVYPDPDSSQSDTIEIVLWDWESETIIRQIPVSSAGWLSPDGQVIFSSGLASGLPAFYLDIENTEGEILFSSVVGEYSWSSDGYLAYCDPNQERGWILSIWNGQETWEVTQNAYKPVQWQNGGHTFFCNSG